MKNQQQHVDRQAAGVGVKVYKKFIFFMEKPVNCVYNFSSIVID